MHKRLLVSVIVAALVATSCAGTATTATTTRADIDGALVQRQLTMAPGRATINTLTIDGTPVDFSLMIPDGYLPGTPVPVLLALPPGGQTLDLVEATMDQIFRVQANARGWVVVSPVAPNGELFFKGAEDLLVPLMDQLEAVFPPEGGRSHLGGMSNGGISAFRVAANQPDRWASITVYPGYPQSRSDRGALEELADVPMAFFVGEADGPWISEAQDTVDTLIDFGATPSFTIVPGEGHVLQSLATENYLWNALADHRLSATAG